MIITLALIAILQALFLPGMLAIQIANRYYRREIPFIDQLIIATPLSIIINYYFVFFACLLQIYTSNILLINIVFQFILTTVLLYSNRNYQCIAYTGSSKKIATNKFSNYLSILFFALGLSIIIAEYIPDAGNVFTSWDAVASWNQWGVNWFNQKLVGTLGYPQAIPIMFSLVYKLAGETNLQTFSKLITDFFPFYGYLCFYRLASIDSTKKILYSSATIFYSLFLIYGNKQIPFFAFSGYVDAPVAALSAFILYAFITLHRTLKVAPARNDLHHVFLLFAISCSSISLLKQSGLPVALICATVWFVLLFKTRKMDKMFLLCIVALSILIAGFWYVYSYFIFNDYARAEHLIQIPFLQRPEEGLKILIGCFGVVSMCLIMGTWVANLWPMRIFLVLVAPMFLFWSILVNYDTRTSFIIFPWLAYLAGYSIFKLSRIPTWGAVLSLLALALVFIELKTKSPFIQDNYVLIISITFLAFILYFVINNYIDLFTSMSSKYPSFFRILILAMALTALFVPSFFVSNAKVLEVNNRLRILGNDQGFNFFLNDLLANDKNATIVSEWMTARNIPALEGRLIGSHPKNAPDAWISQPDAIYYLHWAGFPGSLPIETVRDKATSNGIAFSETSLKQSFTLFTKKSQNAGSFESKMNNVQIPKPKVDLKKSKLLYDSIKTIEPGADYGKVEWINPEILIHPGNSPTSVSFKIPKELENSKIQMWMMSLPEDILSNAYAGTVSVDIMINGKLFAQANVDRSKNFSLEQNFKEKDIIEVTVNNKDTPFWDGFRIGVE